MVDEEQVIQEEIQDNQPEEVITADEPVELAVVEDKDGTQEADTVSPVIAVTVAITQPDRVVLEWRDPAGSLRRAWADAPVAEATEQALEALEPYGDDLSAIAQDVYWSQARVVDELHRMGVWRVQDVNANVLSNLYQGMGRLAARQAIKRANEAKASGKP